jgi:hypothetical protein
MKTQTHVRILGALFSIALSTQLAAASELTTPQIESYEAGIALLDSNQKSVMPFTWEQLREFALNCAEQPYAFTNTGKKVVTVLRTTCPDDLKVEGRMARFVLNHEEYVAHVFDSRESDGGDLNDLIIQDRTGSVVAHRQYILAFGDVVLAMAAGDDSFRMVLDDTILNR